MTALQQNLEPSSIPEYRNTTTFREIFTGVGANDAGASTCVRDIHTIRFERPECKPLIAKIMLACDNTQAELLLHIWSAKFYIDDDIKTAMQGIVKCGRFLNFLDINDRLSSDLMKLLCGVVQHARSQKQ